MSRPNFKKMKSPSNFVKSLRGFSERRRYRLTCGVFHEVIKGVQHVHGSIIAQQFCACQVKREAQAVSLLELPITHPKVIVEIPTRMSKV